MDDPDIPLMAMKIGFIVALPVGLALWVWDSAAEGFGSGILTWIIISFVAVIVLAIREGSRKAAKRLDAIAKLKALQADLDAVQAQKDAAIARDRAEERARIEKQRAADQLKRKFGPNAEFVASAVADVKQIVASEAARAGWLGDVDFTADLKGITDHFQKAHDLRNVANKLSVLDKPGADDRKILAEANKTIAKLEKVALKRVELIAKCAQEANLVDESLRRERADAQTAEQRAELHAKLSGMLYRIEATPDTTPTDSAAVDGVLARVQAYREIKNEINTVS